METRSMVAKDLLHSCIVFLIITRAAQLIPTIRISSKKVERNLSETFESLFKLIFLSDRAIFDCSCTTFDQTESCNYRHNRLCLIL